MGVFNKDVKVVAAICDIGLEIQDVDLLHGEQKQDWYLKINPKAKILNFQVRTSNIHMIEDINLYRYWFTGN